MSACKACAGSGSITGRRPYTNTIETWPCDACGGSGESNDLADETTIIKLPNGESYVVPSAVASWIAELKDANAQGAALERLAVLNLLERKIDREPAGDVRTALENIETTIVNADHIAIASEQASAPASTPDN